MAIRFTQLIDLDQNRITNVGAPAVSSDAVTKQYVDNMATGLIWKDAVRVAADSDVNLASPGTAIDGVTLAADDRVLLMGQSDPVENGIYVFDGSALARADDFDQNAEVRGGAAVTVSEGTGNGNHTYVMTADGPVTVGTTALSWSLLNAGTSPVYTGSHGVDITNNNATAVAAPHSGISVGLTGIGVIADPDGGLLVGTNGVATKLPANSGLKKDSTGLAFVPRPDTGLDADASGVGVKLKASSGLAVDANGVQTVLAADKGLIVDSAGLQVKSGNGVATDANGVKVVADNAGGLQVQSAGVGVKLDTPSGLKADSNGLAVVPGNGVVLDPSAGVQVKPKTDAGVVVDGTGVSVKLRANDGLDVDAGGIGIITDNAGGLQTGVTGLGLKLRPDDGLDVSATGVGVLTDAAGGLATTALGLKAVAGLGITVGADIAIDLAVVPRKFSATVGDGSATTIALTHNLNTRDVQVQVYATASPYDTVYTDVERTDANTVTLRFGTAPTSGQYRAVVIG